MTQTKEEKIQKRKEYDRKRYPLIKEQKKEYDKKHHLKHRERYLNTSKQWYLRNKYKIIILKVQAFNILGGCKCSICGDEELSHLTIDHIDETGYIDRKSGFFGVKLLNAIILKEYPKEKLSNLRILCWNCNCERIRQYLDIPYENQNYGQRRRTKIRKEAYEFFGPCKSCGDSNLKHLTLSHINNNGAEEKRKGYSGNHLLQQFKKLGWPQSLKQDYCLECWNCNCSREFSNL